MVSRLCGWPRTQPRPQADGGRTGAPDPYDQHGLRVFGDGEGEAAPTLVMREHRTRATESHPVTTKGGGVAWIRKKVAEAIKRTGLKQFIFKTDQ